MRVLPVAERDVTDIRFVHDAVEHRAIVARQFRQAANGRTRRGREIGLFVHQSLLRNEWYRHRAVPVHERATTPPIDSRSSNRAKYAHPASRADR